MEVLNGKRLLLLGGSKPYVKVAKAAKALGIHVIVVDQKATNEVLQYADEYLQLSLLDFEGISAWCKDNPIDGVINLCVDFAQRTYLSLCNTFNLPCFYNQQQVDTLANKNQFKELLVECGLSIIKTYDENDIIEDRVSYPIIVKPSEGSGSRGMATCTNKKDALIGIKNAKNESRNGEVIIEEYIEGAQEIQITYFLHNGEVHVLRTTDSYKGTEHEGLERVVVCAVSPSRYTELYMKKTHADVLKMVKKIGLHDGPFFMQGFFHEGKFKFFDPGCRFPGVDYDSIYELEYGFDIAKTMVLYALSRSVPQITVPSEMYSLHGKRAAVLFPVMKAGTISTISGLDVIDKDDHVFSMSERHTIGDIIRLTHDVNQRFGEIDIIANSIMELIRCILFVQKSLSVKGIDGAEMLYNHFDVNRIVV